ncbi:hypothetical protein [Aeromonas enteropelogenes]|uniref:hypothetical protein n=1 Tax=Aeromonas enteropelogenes TaxID=29489 RepID=UPI003BA1D078
MTNKAIWASHEFNVYTPSTEWYDRAGIYIFAKIGPDNHWNALYIGQTNSFSERLSNHERWIEAAKLGATHVHARVVSDQRERDDVEAQLIRINQPPLNTQLK